MKTYLKYLTLGLFASSALLTAACNNNFRAMQSTAPGATAAGEYNVDFEVGEEPGDDTASPEATYTLALIDQVDASSTFAIQGELNRMLEDGKRFRFVDPDYEATDSLVYVVRMAPNGASGGGSRDFAFFYSGGPSTRASVGSFYVEHQDIDNYLMVIPNLEVPDMMALSSEVGVSQEALFHNFADYVYQLNPKIEKQGIQQPEASDLPDTLLADWLEYVRANEGAR